jgi:hypothetical protein
MRPSDYPRHVAAGLCVIALSLASVKCGGDSKSPTTPTQPSTQTRIISLNGNLAYGDVMVGTTKSATLTITNSGNSALTISGLSVSGTISSSSNVTASWTNGQIPAGGSQNVTINFTPTGVGGYSGTVTVNGDQTSGTNGIQFSGTGLSNNPFTGQWSGTYVVERCDGTGSVQDLLCSTNRGAYPLGTSLPIGMVLTQSGNTVTGAFALGTVSGPATGTVSPAGVLTLQGTATSGTATATITSWSTTVQGNVMSGFVTYNFTIAGIPGVGSVGTRLSRVTK